MPLRKPRPYRLAPPTLTIRPAPPQDFGEDPMQMLHRVPSYFDTAIMPGTEVEDVHYLINDHDPNYDEEMMEAFEQFQAGN